MNNLQIITGIIGSSATLIGTSLMLPQVIKSFKTKKVEDISYGTLVLYFLNCLLWLMYGILIVALPIVICNFIALIISVLQIFLKIKYSCCTKNQKT